MIIKSLRVKKGKIFFYKVIPASKIVSRSEAPNTPFLWQEIILSRVVILAKLHFSSTSEVAEYIGKMQRKRKKRPHSSCYICFDLNSLLMAIGRAELYEKSVLAKYLK